ncbi:AAA family ATPase [Muricauda sp. JGD-17]|uniref:Gluconokinase n=1 Tax=Flagellimonas ochracea TaxID=2696472 RepID=A0A964TAI3_9FLAO|nr:gluconokinase [Allomuricauda ochracea]NAY90719.1 AAA family ATPase [Allomuricauda ochracea]
MPLKSPVLVIMGVSGTGKSTIGKLLANKLNVPFFDGDDFHPKSNIEKMGAGIPLNDSDREGWLKQLNQLALDHELSGAVIACSALKESYREILKNQMNDQMEFIFLQGSLELIKKRMEERKGHFMPTKLLQSQFDTLEVPKDAITIFIDRTPEELVSDILMKIQ